MVGYVHYLLTAARFTQFAFVRTLDRAIRMKYGVRVFGVNYALNFVFFVSRQCFSY